MRKPSSITWLLAAARLIEVPTPPSGAAQSWRRVLPYLAVGLILAAFAPHASAQTSYTSTSSTGLWFSSRWNNTSDASPYTSAFIANNAVNFATGTYVFTGGGTGSVGNVTLAANTSVTFSAISGTWGTGGAVRTFDIGAGSLFDLNSNAFGTTAGSGLIKNGAGVFATGAGGATDGSFTLNAGTVIARGTTGLGSGTGNTLVLNGGTLASNDSRSFANTRFGGGITIGGNVQFGELATIVALANSTANLSFANNVFLGAVNRIFTQGNNGANTFSAIISNTGSGGITFAANANTDGRFEITNAANTFTGDVGINGGEVRFTADGSIGNAANDIIIDGGRFGKANDTTTVTLGAGRDIYVGDGAGTSISSASTGTLIYNNAIANKVGETGSWAKQGGGTLELGGVSTYTGNTFINNGILKLTTGNNRLPTGTVVSLGQAASPNVGTFNLNGLNQQIAGLASTTGTNSSANKNTVTSATAATLDINVANGVTHTYGDGSLTNSGVLTGALSLVKTGSGTQVLGDANTFSGGTTLTEGTLGLGSGTALGTGGLTINGGTLAAITVARNVANNMTVGGDFTLGGQGFSTTFNGTVDLGGATRSITLANTATINGVISNGGLSLSISAGGSKTLILSGTNTFTGGTTISSGTLQVGAGGATGSLAGAITNNASLVFNHSGAITAANLISGTGSVTKQGAGILTLSGANTFTGTSTISAGTLLVGHLTALGTGAVTVNGGTLDLNTANLGGQIANVITVTSGSVIGGIAASAADTAGTVAVTGVLTGAADLTKTTAGTLTLSTPHYHTGATVANTAGVIIKVSHLADTGSSLGAGTLSDPTKLQLGAGAVLEFTGATTTSSTRSFTLTDSAGITTAVGSAGLTFTSAAKIALSGANPALALVANNSVTNFFRASLTDADIAASNGLKTLTIDGAGVWVIGGNSNRFKQDIRVEAGTGSTIGLESSALPNGAGAVIALANNARVRYEAGNTDDLSDKLTLAAGTTGKLDLGNNNVAFNSALAVAAGTGSTATLTKEGAGKLTIAAGNNTNLNLSVTAGTLVVNSTLGNVSLAAGTSLGGSGTVGAITTVSGAIIGPGNSPGNLTSSSVALVGGTDYEWQVQNANGGAGVGYDTLTVTGALDVSGASSGNRINLKIVSLAGNGDGTALGNPLNFGPPAGASSIRTFTFATVGSLILGANTNISDVFTINVDQFKYSDGSTSNAGLWSIDWNSANGAITLTAVPEPSTYGLGLGALALAAAAIRRRKQKAKA